MANQARQARQQVRSIAQHFGKQAVLVLVAWAVVRTVRGAGWRFFQRRRREGAAGASQRDAAGPPPAASAPRAPPARFRVCHRPLLDLPPSNPQWLQEAAAMDSAALATDLSWQCPALIAFQAKVAAAAASQGAGGSGDGAGGSSGGGGGGAPMLPVAFGRAARGELFALDPSVAYLNHGSYGAAFRLALDVREWYGRQLEAQPVRFMETTAMKGLVAAVADAARFVGAAPADVAPLLNATTAVNAVVAAVGLRRGDWALIFNTTYPAVRSTVARAAAAAGASVLEVQLGVEELADPARLVVPAVQAALASTGGSRRVRLALIDHVASFPPVVMPVAALVGVCKAAGAQVLVDGAHAVGNVPGLQIPALGADYYTTNLHKWACAPKGTALLWAAPERQAALRPLVTSHGCGMGFRAEFLWQGTHDPSPWLAVSAALAVLRALGPDRVAAHNANTVAAAAAALVARWGGGGGGDGGARSSQPGDQRPGARPGTPTPAAAASPATTPTAASAAAAAAAGSGSEQPLLVLGGGGDWEAGGGAAGMLIVQLPPRLRGYGNAPRHPTQQPHQQQQQQHQQQQQQQQAGGGGSSSGGGGGGCTAADAVRLQRWLRGERGIEVPVAAAFGRLWVRLSAQVYNEPSDYARLGDAIAELQQPAQVSQQQSQQQQQE